MHVQEIKPEPCPERDCNRCATLSSSDRPGAVAERRDDRACGPHSASQGSRDVWFDGTHGSGEATTSALVQHLIPNFRVFDAEKVVETLKDITAGRGSAHRETACVCSTAPAVRR
jgi:hypothetical protein